MLKVTYWVGSKSNDDYRTRQKTLGTSVEDLVEHLQSISDTPEILLHLVLTSYSTLFARAVYWDANTWRKTPRSSKQNLRHARRQMDDEDDVDADLDGDVEQDAQQYMRLLCPRVFHRIILNKV